jgi:hypothetical protein
MGDLVTCCGKRQAKRIQCAQIVIDRLAFPKPLAEFVELTYAEPFFHFAPMKRQPLPTTASCRYSYLNASMGSKPAAFLAG